MSNKNLSSGPAALSNECNTARYPSSFTLDIPFCATIGVMDDEGVERYEDEDDDDTDDGSEEESSNDTNDSEEEESSNDE